jgi:hypothetical protein
MTATSRSLALLALVLVLSIGACTEEPDPVLHEQQPKGDAPPTILPMEGARDTAFNPANVESFHDVVFRQYARLAVGLPRRVMDSIVNSVPPPQIQEQMEIRLRQQDTIARRQLADKYGISRDSINAILATKNVPRR